jgi:hypothetical protein
MSLAYCRIAPTPIMETYSDIRYVEESGDVIGAELELTFEGGRSGRVTGALRFFEGSVPEIMSLSGFYENQTILATGEYSEGIVRVTVSRESSDLLKGVIEFDLGSQINSVPVRLRRID